YKKDEKWKTTPRFKRDDLPSLAEAALRAQEWMDGESAKGAGHPPATCVPAEEERMAEPEPSSRESHSKRRRATHAENPPIQSRPDGDHQTGALLAAARGGHCCAGVSRARGLGRRGRKSLPRERSRHPERRPSRLSVRIAKRGRAILRPHHGRPLAHDG